MNKNGNHKTTVSTMIGAPVLDARAQIYGHVRELAVRPTEDDCHVTGLLVQRPGRQSVKGSRSLVPIAAMALTPTGGVQLLADAQPLATANHDEFLLLERDLLDQQIIDVHGHKVVRVNDVDLLWIVPEEEAAHLLLRITGVEVGLRGAVRRVLKGIPPAALETLLARLKSTTIPWDFVDLIDRDPSRRVKLKIEQDRLSKMHPSDLADILEDLAPAERNALFVSLDEDVAAETLEEIEPRMQQSLIESLNSEQVAGIVEEMDPAAAADLLSELPDERSEAILGEMDPEERQEVQDLLEFPGDSAAGLMTTEYVALQRSATVGDVVRALEGFDGDLDSVTEILLLDEAGRLHGVAAIARVFCSSHETPLEQFVSGHLIKVHAEMRGAKVAEVFEKYNLRALPVVDQNEMIVGVIYAERIIEFLHQHK